MTPEIPLTGAPLGMVELSSPQDERAVYGYTAETVEALQAEIERLKGSELGLNKYLAKLQAERRGLQSRVDELEKLLDEVSACFTRDDDLPDGLIPRIDAARNQGGAQ